MNFGTFRYEEDVLQMQLINARNGKRDQYMNKTPD